MCNSHKNSIKKPKFAQSTYNSPTESQSPHLYFAGNQPEFGTKLLEEDGKQVPLYCDFSRHTSSLRTPLASALFARTILLACLTYFGPLLL